MVKIRNLIKRFGGLAAVAGLSFSVEEGQIKGLIGPNGSGKTTVLNLISGFLTPSEGDILFMGRAVTGLAPHKIARLGIGRTFQHVDLFNRLTVMENVLTGFHIYENASFLGCVLRMPSVARVERVVLREGEEILVRLGLGAESGQRVNQLPLGKQRLVELARALAVKPKLLLLDEPGAGLTREETRVLGAVIVSVCKELKVTVLIVDHNLGLIMGIADEIVAIFSGRKIGEGTPSQIRQNEAVIERYLGKTEVTHVAD